MSARGKGLDITVYSVGGDLLARLKSFDLPVETITDEGRNITGRHSVAVATGKRAKFNAEHMHVNGAAELTNLNVSAWSVGGDSFLADLRSLSINVSSELREGKGIADLFEFPNTTGTKVTVESEHLIPAADLIIAGMADALANEVTSIAVELIFTTPGFSLTIPALISMANHQEAELELSKASFSFEQAGDPAAATGSALIVSALTGTAEVAVSIDTEKGVYAGNALIESASLQVEDQRIVREAYGFAFEGRPTLVAST